MRGRRRSGERRRRAHARPDLWQERRSARVSAPHVVTAEWNAGDLGCGDLVLELMMRMTPMAPGEILRLTALDPGAPADIPAWCRMTGHTLLEEAPPVYLIRRKET